MPAEPEKTLLPAEPATTFHTSEAAFARHYAARGAKRRFAGSTAEEARQWQQESRVALGWILGLNHFEHCDPLPRQVGEATDADGIRREEWLIQSEVDVTVPITILVPPDAPATGAPAVICPTGHGFGARAGTVGTPGRPELEAKWAEFNSDYGLQIARAGLTAVCPEARGFGQRRERFRQKPEHWDQSSCSLLQLSGAPLGLTVQGMWVWDLMRVLDWMLEPRNGGRFDAARVGCAGLSGGGLQTLDFAALDERVVAAVTSGYFYGVQEALMVLNWNCACNLVPRLWESFDMGDLGALIAPRGLFIETGEFDIYNGERGLANVTEQVAISQRVFDLLGGDLQHHVFPAKHRWSGERSIPWLKAKLR